MSNQRSRAGGQVVMVIPKRCGKYQLDDIDLAPGIGDKQDRQEIVQHAQTKAQVIAPQGADHQGIRRGARGARNREALARQHLASTGAVDGLACGRQYLSLDVGGVKQHGILHNKKSISTAGDVPH